MNKANLILIGAGGHARSCIDIIEHEGSYKIAGLVGLAHEVGLKQFGYQVLGSDSELIELANQYPYALITVGQILTADHRIRLYQQALDVGFNLPEVIAPTAYVSPHATIGAGTIVMHGAIINAGAIIGNNCIINNRALIEHDAHVAQLLMRKLRAVLVHLHQVNLLRQCRDNRVCSGLVIKTCQPMAAVDDDAGHGKRR